MPPQPCQRPFPRCRALEAPPEAPPCADAYLRGCVHVASLEMKQQMQLSAKAIEGSFSTASTDMADTRWKGHHALNHRPHARLHPLLLCLVSSLTFNCTSTGSYAAYGAAACTGNVEEVWASKLFNSDTCEAVDKGARQSSPSTAFSRRVLCGKEVEAMWTAE